MYMYKCVLLFFIFSQPLPTGCGVMEILKIDGLIMFAFLLASYMYFLLLKTTAKRLKMNMIKHMAGNHTHSIHVCEH